ncbi:MAG: tyrosine-type recombinase/integrase [Streptosporangiaceae bacterium]
MDHLGPRTGSQAGDPAGPGRAGAGAGPLAGPPGRAGLRSSPRGAAQARPLCPAHLHRPGAGGPVRPDRPLPLRLAGTVPALGHAGAVPHDLRVRPAASEARLLRFGDVDLGAGVLAIRDGKGGKDRQVPVSAPLRERLADYHGRVAGRTGGDWFFAGTSGRPLTLANIDKNFRRFLWQARIPHGGRGHGPRVHDLRHTMAVNNLRSWFARGEDAGALLPVLQAYMGHSSIADTGYYLRLTAESYPHITARIQRAFGDVVPRLAAGPCHGD